MKPGQFIAVRGCLYRIKRRTNGCDGCALDNPFTCPNIQDSRRRSTPQLECLINDIILVRVDCVL